MAFQLLVVRGRSASDVLSLITGVNSVGRHNDCQIRIKSSQVSRRHCELFEKKGLLVVKDLSSANGTYVNGKRIEGQQVLEAGDELTIGGVKLRVAKVGEPTPEPKVPSKAANDTAIVDAIPTDEPVAGGRNHIDDDEDSFEIDLDDEPATVTQAPVKPPAPAPAPAPASVTAPMAVKTDGNRKAPEPPKPSAPAPTLSPVNEVADEAIADFLLDLKIEDDE